MDSILRKLSLAQEQGKILVSSYHSCITWLNPYFFDPWVIESIFELVEGEHWAEINDRFYKTLAFGTGGLRGRTIGGVVTRAEQGNRIDRECPEHPAVGSNCMNDFNVRRASIGLVAYLRTIRSRDSKPQVVVAHDARHFSRHFAELVAETVIGCGGKANLFESERSTPELSFAVRFLDADGGVVITASHNPPHDNGFKAYLGDGAQVVGPYASAIIRQIQAVSLDTICQKDRRSRYSFTVLGPEIDQAYMERLRSLVLEPEIVRKQGTHLKVVYSPLHGTGSKIVPHILQDIGCQVFTVPKQMTPDGRFPTVKSPNPENAEALSLSVQLAEQVRGDVVLATDPDADRMGVALRNREGKMELLNGNQVGSLLAYYRLERLFAQGILNETNRCNARLIKTVVTTDLQKATAEKFGVGISETLTGFKYIGEKLRKYEEQARNTVRMDAVSYRNLPENVKRDLLLRHSYYYVFGGEESYGYSASDFVRDKDANAACIMFAELAAFTQSRGQTPLDYLDAIYKELGYYQEKLGQLVYEGAKGSDQIQAILRSYEETPPSEIAGLKVAKITNYAKEDIYDSEGDLLPKEKLLFVALGNGTRYAVRGSGTEPKIKFYLFAHEKSASGMPFSENELMAAKKKTAHFLESLWKSIEADASQRAKIIE